MAKNLMRRRNKEIGKELERMGFGKVNTVFLGQQQPIVNYFKSSKINVDQMRVFYGKRGDEKVRKTLEEVIGVFTLLEKFNSPRKSDWRVSFNAGTHKAEFYIGGEQENGEGKNEAWFLELGKQLEKMGFEEEALTIKLTAVFSPEEAFEKAHFFMWELYKSFGESIELIEADLHARINYVIKVQSKKYYEASLALQNKQLKVKNV